MYSMELKLGWSRGSSLGTSCLIAACSVGGSTMGGGGSAGLASMATEGAARTSLRHRPLRARHTGA